MEERVRAAFSESAEVKKTFIEKNLAAVIDVSKRIGKAFERGNKLMIFGNGGSAADAQHLAAEFVNRFQIERPPRPAIALTTDTSVITSVGNDYDYSDIFAKQIKALGKKTQCPHAIPTDNSQEIKNAGAIGMLTCCNFFPYAAIIR